MKNVVKLAKLLFLICIIFAVNNVYADNCDKYACAKCIYTEPNFKFTYDLKSSGDGSAELRFHYTVLNGGQGMKYELKQSLVAKNFINSENKLFCPENLYVSKSGGGRTVAGEVKTSGSENQKATLSSESTNNNLLVTSDGESSSAKSCTYNFTTITGNTKVKLTVTILNDNLKYELSNGFKINPNSGNLLNIDYFSGDGCPGVYGSCGSSGENKYCSLSKTNDFNVIDHGAHQGVEETQITTTKSSNSDNNNNNLYANIETATTECDTLGLLRKDLDGAFKAFKIMAPILVVVFSIYDFIKAFAGKVDGELKKAFTKLIKRLVFALILFFLPTILDFFLGLVDSGYSTCINK